MSSLKQERIIDLGTGEVRYDNAKLVKFSLFDEDKGYMLFINRSQVRTFPHVEWPDGITKLDRANLFELSRHIYSNTNMLAYRGYHNSLRPMNEDQMAHVVELCGKRFKAWLARMNRLGMIARINVEIEGRVITQYYLNPLYFFSAKHLPLNLYILFQSQIDRHLPEWAKRRYADMRTDKQSTRL